MHADEIKRHTEQDPQAQQVSLHPRIAWMMCYNQTGSAQEVCRRFGISRKTFYKWLKRYKSANGNSASLQDQSRRPHHFPNATPEAYVTLLKRLRDETGYGQRRLRVYLQEHYNINISERTIWKILRNSSFPPDGRVIPSPSDLSFGKPPLLSGHAPARNDDAPSNLLKNPFGES